MKALFIICPSLGIGEVYTAVRLSEQLSEAGWEVYFLGNEIIGLFEEIKKENRWVLSNDSNYNYSLLEELVQRVNPDMFIFTDYNMYIKNSYMNFAFDFGWLQNYDISCTVIDTIGNCGYKDDYSAIYEDKKTILTLPDWVDAILRPVPPHDPVKTISENLIYFPVFLKSENISAEDKIILRQEFKVSQDSKLVIFPLGHWIKIVAGKVENRLYQHMIRIILYFFNRLEYDIELVLLGDTSWNSGEYKNVSLRTDLAELPFFKTEELIGISDLVITINRFSNSLGRAARYKVPAISLRNSYDITVSEGRIITGLDYGITPFINKILRLVTENNGTVKRFSIFPEFDTGIINEFYDKNPRFAGIIPTCEIFDQEGTVNMMKKLLSEGKKELVEKQTAFISSANKQIPVDKQLMRLI